jgi:hypothetical protein
MTHQLLQSVALSLPVLFLKEKRTFIAYTPALDLSASGSTTAKAKKHFEVTLKLFLEELAQAGTLEQVLRDMGWSKQERRWQPPVELEKITHVAFRMPVPA